MRIKKEYFEGREGLRDRGFVSRKTLTRRELKINHKEEGIHLEGKKQ